MTSFAISSIFAVKTKRRQLPPKRRLFQVLWILLCLGWLGLIVVQLLDGLGGVFENVCILALWLGGYLASRRVVEAQRKLEVESTPLPPPSASQWGMLGFCYLLLFIDYAINFLS